MVTAVCGRCSIVIYREEGLLKAGKESILAPPMSDVEVGARGRVLGRKMRVFGRIRLEHGRGHWDEWFVQDDQGESAWLVEEEGGYTLERPYTEPLPEGLTDAAGGETYTVGGTRFQVDETGQGHVVGGEGQLPRGFEPGEAFRYVDLSEVGGRGRLSVEVMEGQTLAYLGRAVPRSKVEFPRRHRPPSEVVQGNKRACDGCGAAIDVRNLPDPARTLICRYCGTVHNREGSDWAVTGKNERPPPTQLRLGAKGRFRGRDVQVIGRIAYEERELDDGTWSAFEAGTTEYVLVDGDGTYSVIEVSREGVVWLREQETIPQFSEVSGLGWGDAMAYGPRTFRMYERGSARITYVDGALPWIAKLGDVSQFIDLIDMPGPFASRVPQRLSMEWVQTKDGANELQAFIGTDLDPELLVRQLGAETSPKVHRRILAPYQDSPVQAQLGLVWVILGLVFMGVGVLMGSLDLGEPLAQASRTYNGSPTKTYSDAFTVKDDDLVRLDLNTSANNSWLWAEVDIVDAKSRSSVGFIAQEVSYYHGGSGEDAWSEGDSGYRRFFKISQGGSYRLRLEISEADRAGMAAQVTLFRAPADPKILKYVAALMVAIGLLVFLRRLVKRPNLWPSDD